MRRISILAVLLLAAFRFAHGQLSFPTLDVRQNPGSTMLWVSPKAGQSVQASNLFNEPGFSDLLVFLDEMQLQKERPGGDGITHRRYVQRHSGYEVEGAMFSTSEKAGLLRIANGQLAKLPDFAEEPSLSEADALNVVRTRLGVLGPVASEGDDYSVPKVDLLYAPVTWETGGLPLEYRLAYRVGMVVTEPFSSTKSYVDAHTGELFRLESTGMECSSGNGQTLYHGWQGIYTQYYNLLGNLHWELRDDCRGELIHTRIDNHSENNYRFFKHSQCSDLNDGDNIWQAQNQVATVSLHWAGEMFYDYLINKLGRNSLDGAGAKIKMVYHPNYLRVYQPNNGNNPDTIAPFNAKWEPDFDECHFGRGDGISPWVSLDIVAHELSHGIMDMEYPGMLTGGNESHALGESFADIFSVCCEAYILPLHDPNRLPNFTFGEDAAQGPIRNMAEPWQFFQPYFYQGSNWLYSPNDEPHHNSSVQTYWFYLLAYGSAGKPVMNNVTVCGIGLDAAASIAYRTITDYMQIGAFYLDARDAAIQAAIDAFGMGSFEHFQCANAWAAVGIGNASNVCNPVKVAEPQGMAFAEISAFPNPAAGVVHVSIDLKRGLHGGRLSLWNDMGVKVAELPFPIASAEGHLDQSLDCSDLPAGVYHLQVSFNHAHICKRISIVH